MYIASIFALAIDILLLSDRKQMGKWILKGTTLKTPFHIALFRMKLSSHCTFFQGRFSDMSEVRANLFLAISETGMCLVTFSVV